ncbi:MAG: hypothetical protein R3247_17555 [Rhodothermales bacterium]|nr:hypothetical protein [Rhodothermales bacterium]
MKKLLLGTFLATLTLFIWGFLFWGTPWPNPAFQHLDLEDEVAVWESLRDHIPASGTYYFPDVQREGGFEAAAARHDEGPLATVMIHAEGMPVMSPAVFVLGFLHMFVSALLMALLLRTAAPALTTYRRRAGFVASVGLVVAVWANLGEPVWNYHAWSFELMQAAYDWTSWILAGLVLARFAVPARSYAAA